MYHIFYFVFAFSFYAFAQNLEPPPPIENGDGFSYQLVLGDLEYYLRHNITGIKECYNKVKPFYYKMIQDFGWDLSRILTEGVILNIPKKTSHKTKIKDAIEILRKSIAARLRTDYFDPLWTKIQALHFNKAAVHLDMYREVVRENLDEYRKIMSEFKKENPKDYNSIEGHLRGIRGNIKLASNLVLRNLTICMEEAKCKSISSKNGQ